MQRSADTASLRARPARVAAAGMVGSALEWYDFSLYGTAAALVFNHVVFPTGDPTTSSLLALATFGVGYVVRPVGGLLFGWLGDVLGRKAVLVMTLLLMGVSTMLIAAVPSYASAGLWSPVALVTLRLVQGLGAGAEFGVAAVLVAEAAPAQRRGFFGSWPAAGVYIGLLLASGAFAVVTQLPREAFLIWGWRIPFLLSVVVVAVALIVRLRLVEAPLPPSSRSRRSTAPLRAVLTHEKTAMLRLLFAQVPQNVVSSLNLAFVAAYLSASPENQASTGPVATFIGCVVAVALIPAAGHLSDRIGRRPVVVAGAVFSAAFAFPYFWLIDGWGTPTAVTLAVTLSLGIGISCMFGPQPAYYSELFTARGRVTGVTFAREVSGALTAGTTPLIAVALVAAAEGASWLVAVFVVVASLVGAAAVLLGPETRGRDLVASGA
jgi:MHS family shikimate/dehydroshikimate transporter-like MFS transporter